MSIEFLTTSLLLVSIATNLTVEAIKKLLSESGLKYSSNLLAAAIAVVIAGAVSWIDIVMNDIVFTSKVGIQIGVLMYLSFLVSTVGYDKVKQMFSQIVNPKN